MLFFGERVKPEYSEKTYWSREETKNTHPIYDAGSGNRPQTILVEGELSHYSAIPALRYKSLSLSKNSVFRIWLVFVADRTRVLIA